MRRLSLLTLLLLAACSTAVAQRSHGFFFIAPGGVSAPGFDFDATTLHLGVGGVFLIARGIGIGVEAGPVTPAQDVTAVVGLASLNGVYHFPVHDSRVDPFAGAGYSIAFRGGTFNGFNFGGGLNFWFLNRVGLRLEFRDHVFQPAGVTVHNYGIRFGLAFR